MRSAHALASAALLLARPSRTSLIRAQPRWLRAQPRWLRTGGGAGVTACSPADDDVELRLEDVPADGGGVYFYNESTGESTWDRPSADLPPPPPPPSGGLGGSGGVGGGGGGGGGGSDFEIGGRVMVQGLASKPELNGRLGKPAASNRLLCLVLPE